MPATPKLADTGTPDTTAGIPITMTQVDDGAGVGQRQVVSIASPSVGGRYVEPTIAGALPVDGSAVTQPVSGSVAVSNLPAIQPVSAVALPLPTGASTEATLALIKVKTDNLDVLLSTRTKPADSQTVTGTLASTVADGANVNQGANADVAVTGDNAGSLSSKLRGLLKTVALFFDGTNNAVRVIGTGAGGVGASITVTQASPFNIKDTVGGSVLGGAKGVQQSVGLQTQEMKDTGRVIKVFFAQVFTPAVTEAMVTLTPNTGGVNGATGTSFGVTAGKTLRIQAMTVTIEDSSTTQAGVRVTLRMLNTGATIVTSPVVCNLAVGMPAGTDVAHAAESATVSFPDGIELSGTMTLGISQIGIALAGASVTLIGYEY